MNYIKDQFYRKVANLKKVNTMYYKPLLQKLNVKVT